MIPDIRKISNVGESFFESAIEALRRASPTPGPDGQFPRLLQDLNRAVNRDRPAPQKLEALRAAAAPRQS